MDHSNAAAAVVTIPAISPEEARDWLESGEAVLIDVREENEYQQAHIDGSILVPLSRFNVFEVAQAAGDKKVIFQCRSGKRAEKTWAYYTKATRRQAWLMDGSLMGWAEAGLPVVEGE